jgi:hypothetical protein
MAPAGPDDPSRPEPGSFAAVETEASEHERAATEAAATSRRARVGRAVRNVAVDVTPLREHRDFRLLWTGELISETGHQMTRVAILVQVFALTRSTLAVGLTGRSRARRGCCSRTRSSSIRRRCG